MKKRKNLANHRFRQAPVKYLILSNDGWARGLMSFACLRKRLAELKLGNRVRVDASGIIVTKGMKPDPSALKVLRKRGFTANGYKVQPLTEDLLKKSDVMIALSHEDFNYAKNVFTVLPRKVRILNVPVILGKKEEGYDAALAKIEEGLEEELRSLKPRKT